jgi:hypothetical protein
LLLRSHAAEQAVGSASLDIELANDLASVGPEGPLSEMLKVAPLSRKPAGCNRPLAADFFHPIKAVIGCRAGMVGSLP